MKLKTAAKLQWWLAILLIVIKLPLFIVYKVIEYLHSKADDILFCFVNYVGNKLLLHSDEYKSGVFKNPNVKHWTAMQVWKSVNEESDGN